MFYRAGAILLLGLFISAPLAASSSAMENLLKPSKEFEADIEGRFVAAAPATRLPQMLVQDEKKEAIPLNTFKGRYMLLNLWATWCAPCVREMPALNKLATTLDNKKFVVVAVNLNSNGHEAATAFYREQKLDHLDVYVDTTGRMPALVKTTGLPTTILVDPEGMEIGRWGGSIDWGTPKAIDFIKSKIVKKN